MAQMVHQSHHLLETTWGGGRHQGPHRLQLWSFPETKQVGNGVHGACVGRIRRSCHYYQAKHRVLGLTTPQVLPSPKVLKTCSHLGESAPAGGLLEMQVWGPHLLNRKLEDRPRISSTV